MNGRDGVIDRVAEALDAVGALRNVTDITDEQTTWVHAPIEAVVDALTAAGWREPARTVTTADELETLPLDSVLIDADGTVWRRRDDHFLQTYWSGTHGGRAKHRTLALLHAPLTVIHEGGAP